ncbi:MAG: MFS transporter [Anaerolineales bacterium]|jgi:MFS family permease
MTTKTETIEKASGSWRKWVEPWYVVYAMLGTIIAGLIPVLLPLRVGQSGNPSQVGIVMAAVSLGGLSAPIWGALTDRYHMHRWVLVVGLFLTATGLTAFAFSSQPAIWFGMALLLSVGAAGASTVANLFVVEMHPKSEWDERIGWLQTFYGLGQVIGLLLAGFLSKVDFHIGLLAAATLSAVSVLLGWLTTETPPRRSGKRPVLLHTARHAELSIHSPQRFFHHVSLKGIKQFGMVLRSRFGLFLAVWLLTFAGSAAVFSQYPLLMQKVFGITPDISSMAFGVMAGLGLTLYTPAGNWSERLGSVPILRVSLVMRLVAFVGLFALGFAHFGFQGWLALIAFAFVVFAWSLMSVSGTALAANLSPVGEGEGMGIFNAVNALSGVIGAALGGWVAGSWGYATTSIVAVAGVMTGLILSFMFTEKKLKK